MEGWQIAIVLKPLGLLLICIPGVLLVWFIRHHIPECKLKRILLISWKV